MRSSARICILMLLALAGCKPYVMSSSAVDTYGKADQEIDFLAAVEKMPAVTNNDALHAFLLLQDGDDTFGDYAGRVKEGVRRGWIPKGEPRLANEAARVGWMATAGCVVMNVKGGLTMRVIGPAPRYATKELVYMEILPLRTENQVLTGSEFVDYLNRLQRIAGKNRRERPDSPLGVPAGESAVSPGNEGAIQEGSLPAQGPREAPAQPAPTTGDSGGSAAGQTAPQPAPERAGGAVAPPPQPSGPPSQVPGTMRPAKKPASDPSAPQAGGGPGA
jgi:hypothetical protein